MAAGRHLQTFHSIRIERERGWGKERGGEERESNHCHHGCSFEPYLPLSRQPIEWRSWGRAINHCRQRLLLSLPPAITQQPNAAIVTTTITKKQTNATSHHASLVYKSVECSKQSANTCYCCGCWGESWGQPSGRGEIAFCTTAEAAAVAFPQNDLITRSAWTWL